MAKRLYGRKWSKARAAHLSREPLCRRCASLGFTTPADVVDHIVPHRGDVALFWDPDNWQSLCTNCHSSYKQSLEKGKLVFGPDGFPINPKEGWV